ncbi:MAG: tetratricopeptide repeat protein, partial [Bacteroidota bacterium]|nr:tetratricopeptide repeat protein [Bacteroidota bacterium]
MVHHNNIAINITITSDEFIQKFIAKKDREIDNLYLQITEIRELKDYQAKDINDLQEKINNLYGEKKILETQVKELLEKGKSTDFKQVDRLYQKAYLEFLQGNVDAMLEKLNADKFTQNENELFERQKKERQQASQNRILRAKGLIMKFRFDEAEENFQIAVDIEKTPENIFQYALFLQNQNQFTKAQPLYEEALEIYRELAKDNPRTYLPYVATTLNNLGELYRTNIDFKQAEPILKEALQIRRELAKENPRTYLPYVATTLNNLANLHSDKNEFAAALE